MADYKITVTFGAIAGESMTPEAIRDALKSLAPGSQLSVNDLDDYVPGAVDTAEQIIAKLTNDVTGDDRLSLTALKDLIKTNITGAQKALNEIAEGNVWSTEFQTINASEDILAGDYFVAKDINTGSNGTSIEDKDWIIALVANPGFTFTDTTKWRILKVSKIPVRDLAFKKRADAIAGSGIEPYDILDYNSHAIGLFSFAVGERSIAQGLGSVATGSCAAATRIGARAFASGRFAASGDAQFQEMVLRLQTTNTTPTEMVLPGPITIIAGKTYDFRVRLLAKNDNNMIARSWEWSALVTYMANPALSTPYSISNAVIRSVTASAMAATLTFNNTAPQRLVITCRGLATTVRWVAYVSALELYNADGSGATVGVDDGLGNLNTYVQ